MMKIDSRQTAAAKKEIVVAVAGDIYVAIRGMNPMHAISEIETASGRVIGIEKDKVSGVIESDKMTETVRLMLANGWEWA